MTVNDIFTDLNTLLGAGTWSNYHLTTPTIWEYNIKNITNLEDFMKAQKEGIVINKLQAKSITSGVGTYLGELQSAKIFGFSSNNKTIRNNLFKDLITILESDGSYVVKDVYRYDESRGHSFLITLTRIESN